MKRHFSVQTLTWLINETEATLTQESVTGEKLCVLNKHFNQLHTVLKPTDSDIVPLLSTRRNRLTRSWNTAIEPQPCQWSWSIGCANFKRLRTEHYQQYLLNPRRVCPSTPSNFRNSTSWSSIANLQCGGLFESSVVNWSTMVGSPT